MPPIPAASTPAHLQPHTPPAPPTTSGPPLDIKGDDGKTMGFKGLCKELYRDVRRRNTTSALESLQREIEEAKTSTLFMNWLDMKSRFYPYSAYNTMLIGFQQMQHFGSMDLAQSKEAWETSGRTLNANAKKLIIIAPRTAKASASASRASDEEDARETTSPKVARPAQRSGGGRVRFVDVPVYDVRDTAGPPLPTLKAPLPGDYQPFLEAMQAEAISRGCDVRLEQITCGPSGAYGYSASDTIVVASDKGTSATRTGTLVHELAHEILHQQNSQLRQRATETLEPEERDSLQEGTTPLSRMVKELEAEATKYVVCRALGIDDGGNAARYLAGWMHNDPTATPSQLKARLERIDAATAGVMDIVRGAIPRMRPEAAQRLTLPPYLLESPTAAADRRRTERAVQTGVRAATAGAPLTPAAAGDDATANAPLSTAAALIDATLAPAGPPRAATRAEPLAAPSLPPMQRRARATTS